MTHVAVVGGGYAGMAAATTLAAQGIRVTVFEAAKQLGGRARLVEYRSTAIDNGLHILIGAYRETLRLIALVNPNAADAICRTPLEWRIHGEFHLLAATLPAPFHLLAGFLLADGLSIREKFSAIRFLASLRACRYALDIDTSVELLLDQHRQSEKLRRVLWRPLCVSALNTPPGCASARIFLNVLRDSLDGPRHASDLVLSKVDLSALFPEPAAAFIADHGGTVLRSRRVTAIDPQNDNFEVEADGKRSIFSHVICAISPHLVNAFALGITALSEIAESIRQLRYQPIHSVWLQYPSTVRMPGPMLGLGHGLVQWVFDRERLCGQRGMLGAVISAQGTHEDLPQHELGSRVHGELKSVVPDLPAPVWTRVIAEKRATFACTPGLVRPSSITPLKNFYLAGDYTASEYPATIESAVRSGVGCARLIANAFADGAG